MVSNFYGNLSTVLQDFGIAGYFQAIVESAVVGVRKPDPAIYALGVRELGFAAHECVVIGDSHSKDILPAKTIGCQTIWLNVKGWETTEVSSEADVEIDDFARIVEVIGGL
jgi:putative hydrolase of the HAD superfamily